MDETQLPAVGRRGALKALAGLAAAAKIGISPVTSADAEGLELAVLTMGEEIDEEGLKQLREAWQRATTGTALEAVRLIVLPPGARLELVKGKRP